jgi:uncharacterized protein (DUF1684 family)
MNARRIHRRHFRRCSPLLAAAALLCAVLPMAAAELPADLPKAEAKPDPAHEVEAWRAERDKGLRNENGWLTLVGLFWLDEGENRFGSDAGTNKVILPEGKAPGVAGTFVRHGSTVRVEAPASSGITVDGKPFTGPLDVQSDAQGKPVVFHLGSLSFFVIQRGDKVGIRIKDSQSPALAAFRGLEYFPLQPAWRVDARFEPYQPVKKIPIANVLGQISEEESPGAAVFDWHGKTYRLDALSGGDDGSLSFIFADQTNGKETYGAGRFLDTGAPKDGRVVVDFNTAYNPPCAFTAFATCPLPPAQNRLALRVEAGEKNYGGGHGH